jgi:hypothetical protein
MRLWIRPRPRSISLSWNVQPHLPHKLFARMWWFRRPLGLLRTKQHQHFRRLFKVARLLCKPSSRQDRPRTNGHVQLQFLESHDPRTMWSGMCRSGIRLGRYSKWRYLFLRFQSQSEARRRTVRERRYLYFKVHRQQSPDLRLLGWI